MKRERDLIIKEIIRLNDRHYLMKLRCEEGLAEIKAGQFVEVRVDGADVLLRRPISVNFVDEQKRELWLMVQEVGRGTIALGTRRAGESINVVYPLGNGFGESDDISIKRPLLIGGGVGVAPLLFLAKKWKSKNVTPTLILGARKKEDLLERDLFERMGRVFVTTEDGSDGEKGFVTQHSILNNESFDSVYCCGPTPMMKAVGKWAKDHDVPCKVSLENKMACGLGACLCCVEDTINGNVRVCVEGPVFNTEELKW